MPTLKPKHPNRYPASFHSALQITGRPPGPALLHSSEDRAGCLLAAKKFRTFLKSLREYPLHPSARALKFYNARTKIIKVENGYQLTARLIRPLNLENKIVNP